MKQEERRERRQKIAQELVTGSADVPELIRRYGVSLHTVKTAAREAGLSSPRLPKAGGNCSLRVVAMLQYGMGLSEIAREIGTTRQYVYIVRQLARQAGVKGVEE